MADKLLDLSSFGKLGPNQVVKDAKTIVSKEPKVIKRGVIDVVEDFSEGFSTAAEMASDYVAVAAGKAYEALPEMDDVLETASSIGSSVKDAVRTKKTSFGKNVEGAMQFGKALTSTPVATMLDDIFLPNLGRTITEKDFSPEATEILRRMALDNNLKAGQSMDISYTDFNKYGANLSARMTSGTNENVGGIVGKLADIKPADEVKMTLGEAKITVDDDGNIQVIDQYDFNSWVNYGEGPDAKGKYKELKSEEFEGSGISLFEAIKDTVENAPSHYQMARNLAFLFGSRDYEDDSKDTGRQVLINLGKL